MKNVSGGSYDNSVTKKNVKITYEHEIAPHIDATIQGDLTALGGITFIDGSRREDITTSDIEAEWESGSKRKSTTF